MWLQMYTYLINDPFSCATGPIIVFASYEDNGTEAGDGLLYCHYESFV